MNSFSLIDNDLDLLNQSAVDQFIESKKPDILSMRQQKWVGIHANDTYPAEFIHQNLLINTNLIHAAWKHGVKTFS
jgi:GDP-L-fucose synthase